MPALFPIYVKWRPDHGSNPVFRVRRECCAGCKEMPSGIQEPAEQFEQPLELTRAAWHDACARCFARHHALYMNMGMNSSRIRTDSFLLVVLADSYAVSTPQRERYSSANPSAP